MWTVGGDVGSEAVASGGNESWWCMYVCMYVGGGGLHTLAPKGSLTPTNIFKSLFSFMSFFYLYRNMEKMVEAVKKSILGRVNKK